MQRSLTHSLQCYCYSDLSDFQIQFYSLRSDIKFCLYHFFAFILDKYLQLQLQLEQQFEDLSRKNLHLITRIEALEEDKDRKDELQSESKQINSHHRDDYTDNETNDNVYTVEENEHDKVEYYESHPVLETMADVVKSNSALKKATPNKVKENPKDGIYKEKRLLIGSGNNIIYLSLKCNLLLDYRNILMFARNMTRNLQSDHNITVDI